MPSFELADLSDVSLTKLVATPSDEEVTEALDRMAGQSRPFADREDGAAAEKGDRVTIDFVGRMDGEEFQAARARASTSNSARTPSSPASRTSWSAPRSASSAS